MKSPQFLTTTILALAVAATVSSSAVAATIAYAPDDLFLGFRKTGATNNYLIDLGPAGTFRDATTGFTLGISGINTDLSAIFGAGWKTDPTVFWGFVATPGLAAAGGDAANVLYASKPQSILGTPGTAYLRDTTGNQGLVRNDINTLASNFNGSTSTANNSVAAVQISGDSASWAHFNPGGQSFSYFDSMEGNFGNGTAGTAMDLFRMTPQTPALGVAGTYEGTFTVNNSGILTFSVPEPGSAVLFGLGASLLGLVRRRRTQP